MDKSPTERGICTKYITPALHGAAWGKMVQIREDVTFTKGRIILRGMLVGRGRGKPADDMLCYRPNISIALIDATNNTHPIYYGVHPALDHAGTLVIPFVFSANGDESLYHDRTDLNAKRGAVLN